MGNIPRSRESSPGSGIREGCEGIESNSPRLDRVHVVGGVGGVHWVPLTWTALGAANSNGWGLLEGGPGMLGLIGWRWRQKKSSLDTLLHGVSLFCPSRPCGSDTSVSARATMHPIPTSRVSALQPCSHFHCFSPCSLSCFADTLHPNPAVRSRRTATPEH